MIYYKGFNKDLKCLGFQYEIGGTYVHTNDVSLCNRGFHYCRNLTDIFGFYSRRNGNRYCIVEPSGKIIDSEDKSVCSELKIIRELSKEEIDKIVEKENEEADDRLYCIDIVKELQDKYNFIIGGSISLYLHGFPLGREKNKVDMDIIMPYYQKFENFNDLEIEEFDTKMSGNDFTTTFAVSSKGRFIKVDVRIKPEQKYDVIEYKENKYKVCEIMTTLEAKCRYAMEGDKKHKEDILYLINSKKT